jgi:hypothetical protein
MTEKQRIVLVHVLEQRNVRRDIAVRRAQQRIENAQPVVLFGCNWISQQMIEHVSPCGFSLPANEFGPCLDASKLASGLRIFSAFLQNNFADQAEKS